MQKWPKRSELSISVTNAAIKLLNHRRRAGIESYGVELLTHNGRCALWDAVEEAADLYLYLLQHYLELKTASLGRDIGGRTSKGDKAKSGDPGGKPRRRRKALSKRRKS